MKKTLLAILLVFCLCLPCFVGCNSGDKGDDNSNNNQTMVDDSKDESSESETSKN